MDKEEVVCMYVYVGVCVCAYEYYAAIKKLQNPAICNDMDGARGYYAK